MKKFIIVLLSFLLLISCSKQIDNVDSANAYYAVFEALINEDVALNYEIIYISLDLKDVKLSDTSSLIQLIQNYCDTNGYTLLMMGIEELQANGYIDDIDAGFNDGIVISFSDKELKSTKLVTSAMKWKSGLGAIGMDFTVEKVNDTWEITAKDFSWIS
jgi:hypothetical protein